jgi:alpha-beta hydrolase superfamily lysophospholipase
LSATGTLAAPHRRRDRSATDLWTARVHVHDHVRGSLAAVEELAAVEDDVLGAPYERMTIELDPDDEGPVVATLVRRRCPVPTHRAVLYVHGYTDYFFQTHLADFYVGQGIDFYGIDLRKHGRSLGSHQTANFSRDLTEYFTELDAALRIIREVDGHTRVLVNGHSTGGLTASIWAHRRRADAVIDALFLNSPFFEFNVPAALRRVLGATYARVARRKPYALVPAGLNQVYGRSLHADHDGEWRYDLAWKPLGGFSVRAGWLTAARTAQAQVQAGLAIPVPILVGTSAATYRSTTWSEAAHAADAVLDPQHMARYAPGLGRHVTVVRFEGARHDLVLSREPVRNAVFAELATWLAAYFPPDGDATTPAGVATESATPATLATAATSGTATPAAVGAADAAGDD